MQIPLLADKNCEIAKAYGVYKEDEGIAFRSGILYSWILLTRASWINKCQSAWFVNFVSIRALPCSLREPIAHHRTVEC